VTADQLNVVRRIVEEIRKTGEVLEGDYAGCMSVAIDDLDKLAAALGPVTHIPDYGDLMTVEQFEDGVRSTCFTDDDGHGFYASETRMSDTPCTPSDVRRLGINKSFTHVVWFNK